MDSFIFTKQKGDYTIPCPVTYEHGKTIDGVFLSSCIRFYKFDRALSVETIQKKSSKLTKEEKISFKKDFFPNLDSFDVKDNNIYLNSYGSNIPDSGYDYSKGIIIAKNKTFMDVIEKQNLKRYLNEFGFDEEAEEEILQEEVCEIKRNPNKKLTYSLGMPKKNKEDIWN